MTPRGRNFEHLKLKNDSNMKIKMLANVLRLMRLVLLILWTIKYKPCMAMIVRKRTSSE